MKIVYTGLESAGKTLLLANEAIKLLNRNKKWAKAKGIQRKVFSNIKFSETIENYYPEQIEYWTETGEILGKTGIDIIWDEISTHFNSLKREPLPVKTNQWLRQGAKQGVHIYATAQEFHDIHLDFRRRVHTAYKVSKILGSGRGGKNLPPINIIWGICISRELDITPYNELEPHYKQIIPNFFMIEKSKCEIFDTHQTIMKGKEQPYEHVQYYCELEKEGHKCKQLQNWQRIKHR
jgi:hypothetical protein